MENSSEPTLVTATGQKSVGMAVFSQIAAIVLAVPAICWGTFAVWTTAYPPVCGDSSGVVALGVAGSWFVDLPIGLLVLAIGLLVKRGTTRLRKICIGTSLLTLSLPILATGIFQTLHCP